MKECAESNEYLVAYRLSQICWILKTNHERYVNLEEFEDLCNSSVKEYYLLCM